MKRIRAISFLLVLCLIFAVSFRDTGMAFASIQSQINNAQDEINNLKNKSEATDAQIEKAEKIKEELEAAVTEMDKELTESMQKYNDLTVRQSGIESEIANTEEKLKEASEKEKKQYDDMKLRIQYMYEAGNQSYIELLMSSKNIVEFINNAAYIVELSLYDREMLKDYQATKETIADSKTKLEEDSKQLDALVADAKAQYEEVNKLVENKQEQVEVYKAEISRLEGNKEIYEDQIEKQTAIIAELEKQADGTVNAPASTTNNNSSSSSDTSGNVEVSAGGFVWPVPASRTITSEFGYRYHPSTGRYHFHSGIDIAASTGSQILAASGGTVTSAGFNSSMGNYVMIAHGNGLVTIYMHASVLCVSSGENVSAGQQIAMVGSTGDSTGPHLHFSVRLNGTYVSPWNYL